ncbi:MAG TPA: hypothetical protein VK002_03030 [Rubricoccaceae bacterium]|nr:hypothetical protein [Rubricoccaceae bacterium]
MLALLLGLVLVGCDTTETPPVDAFPFDPDTTDFSQITSLDYGDYVQPLLAARDVFSRTATDDRGALDDYEWDDVFYGAPGTGETLSPGETIVPFDADGSLLVRFVEDLADDVEIPFPNLRRLQDDEVEYLKRWIEAGARNDDDEVPYHDSEHLLYTAIQGANYVAIIDAERRQVIRNVYFADHGLECAPNGPHYMVFEPDRSAVYVSLINCNTVAKISGSLTMDPSDPAYLLGTSPSFTTPGMMVLDPEADRLYVGRSTASVQGTPRVGVFDPSTMALIEEFDLGLDIPHAIALTPDGRFLLTAPLRGSAQEALATSVDAATGDIVSQVPVGFGAELVHFSILPDGSTATLTANPTDDSPDRVLFFDIADDGTLTLTGHVETGGERAWHAHLDSDGVTVLVPNHASNSVSLIDVPSMALRLEVEDDGSVENWPLAMPYAPGPTIEGAFFVSNSNLGTNQMPTWAPPYPFLGDGGEPLGNEQFGNVTVLDPATGEVLKVILLGRYPSGMEHWMAGGHHHGGAHGGHGGH